MVKKLLHTWLTRFQLRSDVMQTAATTYFLGSKKSPKLWNELLMKVSSSSLSVGLHRLNVTSVDGEMP